jgi:hypothetical protein
MIGFADNETPGGATNGVNSNFTLVSMPNPVLSLMLYRNGILQRQSSDYTISGNAITMIAPSIPRTGDTLQAWYRISDSGSSGILFSDAEIPGGAVNGVNNTFSLIAAPNPSASIQVFRNGVLQRVTVDYTISANTVTFLSGSTPQTGDLMQASYRY